MATVDIFGVPHAYDLTEPTASPQVLVFIHGWLLSRHYWQPLIDLLAPNYQCLSYDLRGFGDSQPLNSSKNIGDNSLLKSRSESLDAGVMSITEGYRPYTPAAYAEDLAMLLKHLNISNAWLIGHSLGGCIALWSADGLPDSIKGVVCINAGGGIYIKEAFEQFRAAGQQFLKRRPRWLCCLPGIDLVFTRANVARPIARCWGRQRIIDFVAADSEAALGALLDSTTETEVNRLPQVVSRLKQPVYFMAGSLDKLMEPKYVFHLASFHPMFQDCGENVIEITNCGHLAMVEQPEAIASQISHILSNHTG